MAYNQTIFLPQDSNHAVVLCPPFSCHHHTRFSRQIWLGPKNSSIFPLLQVERKTLTILLCPSILCLDATPWPRHTLFVTCALIIPNSIPSPTFFSELKTQCWTENKLPNINIVPYFCLILILFKGDNESALASIPGRTMLKSTCRWQSSAGAGQGLDLSAGEATEESWKGKSKDGAKSTVIGWLSQWRVRFLISGCVFEPHLGCRGHLKNKI